MPYEDPLLLAEQSELVSIAAEVSEDMEKSVSDSLNSGSINRGNYDGSMAKLKRMIKEKKDA